MPVVVRKSTSRHPPAVTPYHRPTSNAYLAQRISQTTPFLTPSRTFMSQGTLVPTEYVLDQLALFGKQVCNNLSMADTHVLVYGTSDQSCEPRRFCTQSIYLELQSAICSRLIGRVRHLGEVRKKTYGMILKVYVPRPDMFGVLFEWMHTHDDDAVLSALVGRSDMVEGFVRNAIALGVDAKGLKLCSGMVGNESANASEVVV